MSLGWWVRAINYLYCKTPKTRFVWVWNFSFMEMYWKMSLANYAPFLMKRPALLRMMWLQDCSSFKFLSSYHAKMDLIMVSRFRIYSTEKDKHNERDGISNHQPYDCLLSRLFRRFTGLLGGRYCSINSPLGPRWWHKLLDLRSRDFCPDFEPRCELIAQYRPPMSFRYRISRTKGLWRGKCFHLMTSSCEFGLESTPHLPKHHICIV